MKHIYAIAGMTCNNCKISVEKALLKLEPVEFAEVDLEKSEVTIEMSGHLSTKSLQEALSDNYKIFEKSKKEKVEVAAGKSELQQLYPLFLILGYITTASVMLHYSNWNWNDFMLDFMGLFYIVFSFFKILDLKGFPDSFRMYDPLAKRVPVYAQIYPFIEVVLGLMFLMRFQISVALFFTLLILGITTVGVSKVLLDKRSIQCACLGTALKLPMTKATFIENSIMIVMASIMLINNYIS